MQIYLIDYYGYYCQLWDHLDWGCNDHTSYIICHMVNRLRSIITPDKDIVILMKYNKSSGFPHNQSALRSEYSCPTYIPRYLPFGPLSHRQPAHPSPEPRYPAIPPYIV